MSLCTAILAVTGSGVGVSVGVDVDVAVGVLVDVEAGVRVGTRIGVAGFGVVFFLGVGVGVGFFAVDLHFLDFPCPFFVHFLGAVVRSGAGV